MSVLEKVFRNRANYSDCLYAERLAHRSSSWMIREGGRFGLIIAKCGHDDLEVTIEKLRKDRGWS